MNHVCLSLEITVIKTYLMINFYYNHAYHDLIIFKVNQSANMKSQGIAAHYYTIVL